jgi:hypothetical protein
MSGRFVRGRLPDLFSKRHDIPDLSLETTSLASYRKGGILMEIQKHDALRWPSIFDGTPRQQHRSQQIAFAASRLLLSYSNLPVRTSSGRLLPHFYPSN